VKAEGTVEHPAPEPHATQRDLGYQIRQWVAKQVLLEPDNTQHYRTDLIVASVKVKQVLILDMCFGSDDKLAWEDALIRKWPRIRTGAEPGMGPKFWKGPWFNDRGKLTAEGEERIPGSNIRQIYKHARYVRRYARLERALKTHLGQEWSVRTLPIAVGVVGLVPDFTRRYLGEILPTREVDRLVKSFIQETQRTAIQVWRAWQQE
jgi:hypothetical protein